MRIVDRMLELLDLLSGKDEGYMITEISELLDIPISSTHRMLASLKKHGYTVQDHQTKKYKIGLKVLRLAVNMLNHMDVRVVARPHMEELSKKYGEIVFATILDLETKSAICIDTVTPFSGYSFYVKIGSEMPMNAAVSAQVILAYMGEDKINEVISGREHRRFTQNSLLDSGLIKEKLSNIRRKGYGICDEELEMGVRAIAAPVLNLYGQVIASITMVGIKLGEPIEDKKIQEIQEAAMNISQELGFQREKRISV